MKVARSPVGRPPGPDRRRHARLGMADLPSCVLKLRGGEVLKLLNLSAGGALVECTRRLLPGHRYALQWTSGRTAQALRGEVVRARVWRLQGYANLAYEVALLFDEQLSQVTGADRPVNSLPTDPSPAQVDGASASQWNVST